MVLLATVTLCMFAFFCKFAEAEDNNACTKLEAYPIREGASGTCYHNPDVGARTPEIIKNHGFEVESYNVTTPDGYILALFRIPGEKRPLFFEAGLMCDSSSFLFAGNRSLALLLAKEGYDIWIGDYIGSIYSRKHTKYTTKDKEYWDFSFDDVARDTIPTYLQKVADVSGKSGEVVYMGHSRGYFLALMYCYNNPDDKILRAIIGMSCIAYQDPIIYMRLAFQIAPVLKNVLPLFGVYALFQDPEKVVPVFQHVICPYLPHLCYALIIGVSGWSRQFPYDDLLNFYSHFPSALSLKEMDHETQLMNTGKLQKYNYGERYDLKKITKATYLLYAENDVVVTPQKVQEQYNDLGSEEKEMIKIPQNSSNPDDQWAHLDFLNAKDMKKELLPVVLNILGKL